MRQVIVIGGGQHHNALGVIRALGEAGYRVFLITAGKSGKHYVSASKYVTEHVHLHEWEEIPELLQQRLKRQESASKEVIISCADPVTEMLNNNIDELSKYYIVPGVPLKGKMVSLMDKTTMILMANKWGIHAPRVWSLPKDKEKVIFPCITKSHVSSHGVKADIVICKKETDLETFLKTNEDKIFAQAYIEKKEEVQFIGCSLHGGEKIIIPGMSRILRSQPNTNTGFLEYGPIDPFYYETVRHAKEYIHDCGYSGLFSIEFMRGKDDKIWFLEINFRNDGNAWCVTKAGVNLPMIWVKACLGENYHDEVKEPRQLLMMPEFNDFKLVLQRKVGLIQWLKDWKRTDYFMEWDKHDQKPFWMYIINRLR